MDPTCVSLHLERCTRLRAGIAAAGLRALLVTSRANRRYLVGFDATVAGLWVTPEGLWLQVDSRYAGAAANWKAGWGRGVEAVVAEGHWLDAPGPEGCAPFGVEADHLTAAEWLALLGDAALQPVPCRGFVEGLRAVKEPAEVRALEHAASLTRAAIRQTMAALRPGAGEVAVARRLAAALRRRGDDVLAFPPIVAAGPRTAWPHPTPSPRAMGPGEPILIDAGGRREGYAADLATTCWLGDPSPRLQAAREAVSCALEAAFEAIRPGAWARDVDAVCRDTLWRLGFGGDYPHDTGHGVGLEVHEWPRVAADSTERLKPGMVLALEPAWYDPSMGGVRIEEMVLVTDRGGRRLGDMRGEPPGFPLLKRL